MLDPARGGDALSGHAGARAGVGERAPGRGFVVTEPRAPQPHGREVRCIACGEVSRQRVVAPAPLDGAPDLDMRPGGRARADIASWLQQCPSCGYAAPRLDAGHGHDVEPIVRSAGYAAVRASPALPPAARPFACHALILEELGHLADAGLASLHAAWACDDAGEADAARACRARALDMWEHGKHQGLAFADDHAQEFCLVADVLRRAGRMDEALVAVREGSLLPGLPPILAAILAFQLDLIQRGDQAAHSLDEIEPESGTSAP